MPSSRSKPVPFIHLRFTSILRTLDCALWRLARTLLHYTYRIFRICECTSFVTDDWQRSDSDVHWDASRKSRIGTMSSQPRELQVSLRFVRIYMIGIVSRACQFADTESPAFLSRSPLASIYVGVVVWWNLEKRTRNWREEQGAGYKETLFALGRD